MSRKAVRSRTLMAAVTAAMLTAAPALARTADPIPTPRVAQTSAQDLRSPDAVDAATAATAPSLPGPPTWPVDPRPITPAATSAAASSSGSDGHALEFGIAGALAVFALGGGLAVVAGRRRAGRAGLPA